MEDEGESLYFEKIGEHYTLSVPRTLSDGILLRLNDDKSEIRMTKLGISNEDEPTSEYSTHKNLLFAFDDGGYALLEVIENSSSTESFQYRIELDEGQTISMDGLGGYQVVGKNGDHVAYLEAPWAFDSAGTEVPTQYVLNDGVLTLQVDHAEGEYAYPIIADPCWKFWSAGCRSKVAAAGAQSMTTATVIRVAATAAAIAVGAPPSAPVMATAAVSTSAGAFVGGALSCMAFCDPDE